MANTQYYKKIDEKSLRSLARLMTEHTSNDILQQLNTKNANVLHLAAARGNAIVLEEILTHAQMKLDRDDFRQFIDVPNDNGKDRRSPLDIAAANNGDCIDVLKRFDARHYRARNSVPNVPIDKSHHWHRSHWQEKNWQEKK